MQNPYSAPKHISIEPAQPLLPMGYYVAIALMAVVPTIVARGQRISQILGFSSTVGTFFVLGATSILVSVFQLILLRHLWSQAQGTNRWVVATTILMCFLYWLLVHVVGFRAMDVGMQVERMTSTVDKGLFIACRIVPLVNLFMSLVLLIGVASHNSKTNAAIKGLIAFLSNYLMVAAFYDCVQIFDL